MRTQRITVAACALLVAFTLAGCGAGSTPSADGTADEPAQVDTQDAGDESTTAGMCAGAEVIDMDDLLGAPVTAGPSDEEMEGLAACRATADVSDEEATDGEFTFMVGTAEELGVDACTDDEYTESVELSIPGGLAVLETEGETVYSYDGFLAGVPTTDGKCASISLVRAVDGEPDPFTADEVSAVMTAFLDGAGVSY